MPTHDFTMHPKLLRDVIMRQAGSLWKAALEGVMNSVEAGASQVTVSVDAKRLRIADDGRGFQDAAQIDHCFKVFGQPHDASEGKRWAEFRMGRGQLFAHGVNTWRTGTFRMTVDIAAHLGYDLEENLPDQNGCIIDVDLHAGLSDSDIYYFTRELERAVRFVDIPVVLNGVVVSRPPANQAWDAISTDDAYIRVKPGSSGIDVYNAGVYLQTINACTYGLSGIVVSRAKLQVNFARNDVMASCPVWRRIRAVLERNAAVERTRAARLKTSLSDTEREAAIVRLRAGELSDEEFRRLRFLWDVSGMSLSVDMIRRGKWANWTMAAPGDSRADRLQQEGVVLVLDEACVESLGLDPAQAMAHDWSVTDGGTARILHTCSYVPFATASAHMQSDLVILPESAWTPNEHRWIAVLTWALRTGGRALQQAGIEHPRRRLVIGLSDTSDGWTDGTSFIAINRHTMCTDQRLAVRGRLVMDRLWRLLDLLGHEFAHDGPSAGAKHDRHFYKRYHDLMARGFMGAPLAEVSAYWTPKRIDALTRRIAKGRQDVLAALAAGDKADDGPLPRPVAPSAAA